MTVKVRIHADPLAIAVTKSFFDYDPYNGMFRSEMIQDIDSRLKSLDGCKMVLQDMNDLFIELLADHNHLIGEYSKLKRGY